MNTSIARDISNAAIDAFLAAARADGWKLVRREASVVMHAAGERLQTLAETRGRDFESDASAIFAAMWDSAPEVTTAPSPASQPSGK